MKITHVSERDYLSIGEVLGLLQDEFPDITISKIRFLESQGLIDPERTASGYRKFYDGDIERLRLILRAQKDNYLPLKVIKDRLLFGADDVATEPDRVPESVAVNTDTSGAVANVVANAAAASAGPAPSPVATAPLVTGGLSLTAAELAEASGLTIAELADAERFGLLHPRMVGGVSYYDEAALVIARAAASFARHGIEARHLRMYRNAAEREVGLFEQVVLPLLKQRNPRSRAQAVETLEELARLGRELREALVHEQLRPFTE